MPVAEGVVDEGVQGLAAGTASVQIDLQPISREAGYPRPTSQAANNDN